MFAVYVKFFSEFLVLVKLIEILILNELLHFFLIIIFNNFICKINT